MPPASPPRVSLTQNYPNPVHSGTQIDFTLVGPLGSVPASLRIFSASGRLVRTLVNTNLAVQTVPTTWSLRWDGLDENGRRQSSGIYYYKLDVQGAVYSKKLVLLR